MVVKPVIPNKTVKKIKANYAEIKSVAREMAAVSMRFKELLFDFLDVDYAYIALDFDSNKAMVDDIASCYERSPKTIYNIINEIRVLIVLDLEPDSISQSTALALKGRVDQDNWKEVYHIALDLVDGNVSNVTERIMKKAIQIFEEQAAMDESEKATKDDLKEDFESNSYHFKSDQSLHEDEPEPVASRGLVKSSAKAQSKNLMSKTEKDFLKDFDSILISDGLDRVFDLRGHLCEMLILVDEMEKCLVD